MNQNPTTTDPAAGSSWLLFALNRLRPHIYAGTVPHAEVQRRRKRNRQARSQRRTNRARGRR